MDRIYIALNFGTEAGSATLPAAAKGNVVASTLSDRDGIEVRGNIDLRGNEGVLIRLT